MELREALGVDALRGHDTGTLDPPSNLVRVFISSTISGRGFTDKLTLIYSGLYFDKSG